MTTAPLAIVEFGADRRAALHLTADAGWSFAGPTDNTAPAGAATLGLLGRLADPGDYGPADGDPVACAAAAAARLLGGAVTFVREPEAVPHETVF